MDLTLLFVRPVSPETSKKYPEVVEISKSEKIRAVIFGVDGAYIVIGTNRDYASDPTILPNEARIAEGVRIESAALGAAGVWAAIDSDRTVREHGVDERIVEAMRAKPVKVRLLVRLTSRFEGLNCHRIYISVRIHVRST